jgi:hypothetical protein
MSFPLYPNTTAGLAAVGPVQAMSDRNEAQTYMANGGQMFASGGIALLAEGGSTALPKYKYDPITQRYVLVEDEGKKEKAGLENLVAQRGVGGEGHEHQGVTKEQADVFDFMNTERGASYKDAFGRANSSVLAVLAPGGIFRGALNQLENPFTAWDAAREAARADRVSNLPTGYEGVGGPNTYSPTGVPGIGVGSREGINALDAQSDATTTPSSPDGGGFVGADPGGMFGGAQSGDVGFAYGGLAALAGGGMSHLGDYSDGGRLLRGPGDGVSDSIPGVIGGKRPARLADGEFVVSADVVSGLGNGSTEAGARKLYAMMDRVRKARTGNAKMGKTINPDKLIPR